MTEKELLKKCWDDSKLTTKTFEEWYSENTLPIDIQEAIRYVSDCTKDMGFMGSPKYYEQMELIEKYKNMGGIGMSTKKDFETAKEWGVNKTKNKLLIIGHARHGKDSLAELLNEGFGLKFKSSSQAAADIFIFDELKGKYGYETPEQCFEDRVNHRPEWYEMICDYNKIDQARLAKGILERTDCYVGMRDRDEITECVKQGLFDLIIWVDASQRLPLESSDSFNIDKSCADIIIDNNGSLQDFKDKVARLGKIIIA